MERTPNSKQKAECIANYSQCNNLINGIMRRKVKGKEFPKWEDVRNRAISKRRCFVEHTFGGIHLWFGGGVTRYVGVERTHTQGILEALAYNIKRMLRIPLSAE